MNHKTRSNDTPEQTKEILIQRSSNGREVRKILFLVIAILLAVSGFFGTRWISSQELTDENILKKAYNYTDQSIMLYKANVDPYLTRIRQNEKTVQRMALNIERITAFMEIRFGMPPKKGK